MIPWHSARHFLGFIACWLVFQPTTRALSQDTTSYNEVYLTFQYRGIANVYITSYYVDGEFYLPVDELFNVLEISHQVDLNNLTVSGTYFEEGRDYVLNFSRQTARIGDRTLALQADDFLVREIDFFVRPRIFEELFDLVFTVDFNNLTLELEPRTRSPLPVIARYEREQRRRRSSMNQPRFQRSFFPLRYGRDYDIVDGAFLDYNYTVLTTDGKYPTFSLSNALGTEFLGGDLQGSSFANFSNNFSDFTTNNLRWRFVNESYGVFSSAYVGQIQTEGVVSRNIRGAKVTNKPVEPRLLFDQYVVEGNTTPLSEVELYLNNALIDFQEADELGNYRFVVPLTYGSSQYSIRIYTPSGQEIERNARIQIPFDYIPPGEIDYTVSGGELEYPIFGTTDGGYIASSVISAGLTRWLTAKLSAEYLSDYHTDGIPSVTGGFSARLFSNYLVTAQANSDQYYRLTSSVVYPNGASWNLNYEYNPGDSRLYNPSGSDHLARLNLYTPFRIGKVPINIRWSSFYQRDNRYNSLRYRVDLNTRLSRLNIRFGYQDQQFGDLQFTATPLSRLTNTYTYTFGRHPGVPGYLRGSYLRGQVSYLPQLEELEEVEFQYSRDIFGTGQIQLTASRNFFADFDMVGLNITIDLSGIRTNSTARATRSNYTLAQNFRGSVGLDFESGQMLFNNRQQVGQAGAAVRLYIDNDNDGIYDPAVDDPVRDPALRIGRAGGRTTVKNGINYISQLLPYYRYNIDINKSALENPLLVPEVNNFSIITDPNQYKSIDVPFYLSGVISGQVQRAEPGGSRGIPGLRLHLEPVEREAGAQNYTEEIRTFSDGSFYTYEVPPGKYRLFVDPDQLEFLNAVSRPETLEIEIEPLAEGDFVENLQLDIVSVQDTARYPYEEEKIVAEGPITDSRPDVRDRSGTPRYQVQIASFRIYDNATRAVRTAEQQFGQPFFMLYNPLTDLHAVRTRPYDDLETAVKHLLKIQKSRFDLPALVVLNNNLNLSSDEDSTYSIQIGAFWSKPLAEKFLALSRIKLDTDLNISYDENDNMYKIRTDKFDSPEQARAVLDDIRHRSYFRDAFVPVDTDIIYDGLDFDYKVRMEGIESGSKQAILNRIGEMKDLNNIEISTEPDSRSLTFDAVPTWQHSIKLRNRLSKLSTPGDPVIMLIQKKAQ